MLWKAILPSTTLVIIHHKTNSEGKKATIMSGDSFNLNISGSKAGNVVQGHNTGNIAYNESNSGQDINDEKLASEIQEVLDRLSGKYSTVTVAERMAVATKAVECIEQDISLKRKIVNSMRVGGIAAISQFLNHPAASFMIAAFEEWNS